LKSRQEFICIGLAGRIGSGKTTIARYLASKYGFESLSYSGYLKAILERKKMPITPRTLQEAANELWAKKGYNGVTRLLLEGATLDRNYSIDGIRRSEAVKYLKQIFANNFYLIFRDKPIKIRHQLYNARLVSDDWVTFDTFLEIDAQETERHIDILKDAANFIVFYEEDITELEHKVDYIISTITKSGLKSNFL